MEGDAADILLETGRSHSDPPGATSPPGLTKVVDYPEPEGGYPTPGTEAEVAAKHTEMPNQCACCLLHGSQASREKHKNLGRQFEQKIQKAGVPGWLGH